MDLAALRAQFPVLERHAYFNAGAVGPLSRAAADAATADLNVQVTHGRGDRDHVEHVFALADRLRGRAAALLGCDATEVALTASTTDGINTVLGGLDLRPGDQIVTSDEEHPGLLAPLAAARERHGVELRVVPFGEVAGAVGARTRLVACSHVSWITGRVADVEALAVAPAPVLLDGAQGLGAVPVDVRALGCEYYAAAGQKWLCGPVGRSYLYVRENALDSLLPPTPGYQTLSDAQRPLDLQLADGAARFDAGFPPSHRSAWALAALDVLDAAGLPAVQERAVALAAQLAERLAAGGLTVAPRGPSTLVSWETADPQAEAERLFDAGLLVRNLPGTPYVRASVGGWTSDDELERLVAAATSPSSR